MRPQPQPLKRLKRREATKINEVNYIESKPTTETRKRRSSELDQSDQDFDSAVSMTSHDRPAETRTIVAIYDPSNIGDIIQKLLDKSLGN